MRLARPGLWAQVELGAADNPAMLRGCRCRGAASRAARHGGRQAAGCIFLLGCISPSTVNTSNSDRRDPPAAPVSGLDAQALDRLRELDRDGQGHVLVRVLSLFEKSLVRTLAQLAPEGVQGNGAAVLKLAHMLKSSSGSVGALGLAAACGEVERRLTANAPGSLDDDIARLTVECEAALLAVTSMLRS